MILYDRLQISNNYNTDISMQVTRIETMRRTSEARLNVLIIYFFSLDNYCNYKREHTKYPKFDTRKKKLYGKNDKYKKCKKNLWLEKFRTHDGYGVSSLWWVQHMLIIAPHNDFDFWSQNRSRCFSSVQIYG